jgi:GT2 family glycosyltransferase
MAQTLSIIVVTLNEARHVARLKSAIDRLNCPAEVEVETLLVDGGSRDGTPRIAREAGFTKVIELPGASIPVCRNRGLADAAGEWIAFLDGDCVPAADWLSTAWSVLRQTGPAIIGWPVLPPRPGTWVQDAWHAHWTNKNRRREEFGGRSVVRHEAFRLITTRNLVMPRRVATQLNGFDENLPTGEDTDFAFRAHVRGVPVLGVPDLLVTHHGEPATLREFFRQQLWHANRRSYGRIVSARGGWLGGNAVLFSFAFLAGLLLSIAGAVLAPTTRTPAWLVLLLPLIGLVVGPALRMAWIARQARLFVPLCILYATYGLARSLDLAGFFRSKPTWKGSARAG